MKLYPKDTPERFEFQKVRDKIAGSCQTDRARDFAAALAPVSEIDTIDRLLGQTDEALNVLDTGVYFPDYAFPAVGHELGMLRVSNAVLEGAQVIKLRRVAEVATSVIRFLGEKREVFPRLREITDGLHASKDLLSLIDGLIEPNGFVKSSASKELSAARKQLGEARQKANKAFEAAVRKFKRLGWLRDYDETFYNDRRVLAVTAEHKRKIDGTLHGSSETGATAYIEPSNLVALNNDVAEALQRESREEYRILRKLTEDLRSYLPILESYEKALGFIDFTFAKARYARQINAKKPGISTDRTVVLIDAFHPVLLLQNAAEGKETVPLTLELDAEKRILVISGPNAGGKSVSLKTFGLLQIMFQSGLPIPAADHSRMAVFRQLFVDIGDDQSIAYELSTYSSRLVKMKHFLLQANKQTLFFIDEFGTGSDPELGGAIAEAILEELAATRAQGVITTHYGNIKIMAEESPVMQNGCMLFDEETLLPKYKLHTGHAGSSYTFEVAQKIGLHKSVIEAAKSKLDKRKVHLDKLLNTLQAKKNQLNRETSTLQREKSNIRKEIEVYRRESEAFKQKQEDLNFQDNKRLIEKGKKYESLLDTWQDKKQRKELIRKMTLAAEKEAARKRDKDAAAKLKEKQERIRKQKENARRNKSKKKTAALKPFKSGDRVKMRSSRQIGEVEEVQKDKATVVFGMMRTIVSTDKLEHVG